MTGPTRRLDWAGAKARLEQIRISLERAENPAPEDILEVYKKRAGFRRVAPADAEKSAGSDKFLVFQAGRGRYAIPASEVREILTHFRIAPVPGAPPAVAGVAQIRGEVRPVYDLGRRLGQAPSGNGAAHNAILLLLRAGTRYFGACVDAVEEIRTIGKQDRKREGHADAPVAFVTEDLVSVLDYESLWRK